MDNDVVEEFPQFETLHVLLLSGVKPKEIADRFGVSSRFVSRSYQEGLQSINTDDLKEISFKTYDKVDLPPSIDLVKKDLIFGEIVDFLNGYDMSVSEMSASTGLKQKMIEHVLDDCVQHITRYVATTIVKAVMKYESSYGDPPDKFVYKGLSLL